MILNLSISLGLIDYILNPIYYGWGMFIAERFSIFTIVLFGLIFLTSIHFLLRKSNKRLRIGITFCYIIFYYLFVFIPYERGKEIINLKNLGLNTMEKIREYKSINGNLPKTLNELYPQFVDTEDLNLIEQRVKYNYYDKKYFINKKDSLYEYSLPFLEEKYQISIYIDFLGPYYLKSNMENTDMLITDN